MGNSFRGDGWLTTRVSPEDWKCLPFCIRRRRVGGVESAERRQVGEKAQEKHLVMRTVGIGMRVTAARSRDGYRRLPERGHHLFGVF
jgi:hypothetical protein